MAEQELVRVKNLSDTPLRVAFNSQPYVIPPKGDAIMPKECACIHFGNWEKRNYPESNKPEIRDGRLIEYKRLRTLYGASDLNPHRDKNWAKRPKVEIFSMEGEKFSSVLDDPTGEGLPLEGASQTDKDAAIVAMQEQLRAMQEQMDSMQGEPVSAPKDSPETAKRRRPRELVAEAE